MKLKCIGIAAMVASEVLLASQAHASLSDGLVAYYPFDGNANDASGHGYNGTVYSATLVPDNVGNPNHAYSFNGFSSYIYFGPVLPDMSSMSVSFWTYTEAASGAAVFGDDDGAAGNDVVVSIPSANGIFIRDDKNGANLFDTITVVPNLVGSWHYITWTLSPQGSVVYLDGSEVGSSPEPVSNVGYHDFVLGTQEFPQGSFGWDGYMSGSLTQLRIYNRVLSAAEVQKLYAETSKSSSPVAGTAGWAASPFVVRCANTTTSQLVTVKVDSGNSYDCEASGLTVDRGDMVAVTIVGRKN